MFGASGSGKTINTIGMLLSAYDNTSGPTVVIDPKEGDMTENYCKAHYSRFGDLRDVYIFSVPETLPALPFFDIRPHTHEGLNRDDAIQQKVDELQAKHCPLAVQSANAFVQSLVRWVVDGSFDDVGDIPRSRVAIDDEDIVFLDRLDCVAEFVVDAGVGTGRWLAVGGGHQSSPGTASGWVFQSCRAGPLLGGPS